MYAILFVRLSSACAIIRDKCTRIMVFGPLSLCTTQLQKFALLVSKEKKKKSTPIACEKRPKFLKANLDKVSQFFEHSVVFLVFKDKSILLTILLDLKTSSKLRERLLPQKKDLTCSKY